MKKSLALFIVAILVLPMLTFATPVSASTGHPAIGAYNGTTLYKAVTDVDVKAGEVIVRAIDGTPGTYGNLTIIFAINSTLLVDFSGAQFDLYMSKNGYSNLTADDVLYASGFSVSDLNLAYGLAEGISTYRMGSINDFYIGTVTNTTAEGTTSYKVLSGPIPFDITNEYQYIKIFDGSATLIAAAGVINILPSFTINPSEGAPCTTVTITGTALAPNTLYNFTYGHTFNYTLVGQGTSTSDGKLVFTFQIGDKADNNWGTPDCDPIRVWINANDSTTAPEYWVLFWEYQSYFTNMSVTHAGTTDYANAPFNNDTNVSNEFGMEFHCLDAVTISGSYFCVSCGTVTVSVDGTAVATAPLNGDGNFTATFTLPALSNGNHVITVDDCSKTMTINITVYPSLIVTPGDGPVGTEVTFSACGFNASTTYYIYWLDFCYEEAYPWHNILNVTTGPDGQFNVSATYVVGTMIGGPHEIIATTLDDGYNPSTMFIVTPSMWVTPSEISNDGSTFTVNVNGLPVECEDKDKYGPVYGLNIDNQYVYTGADGRLGPDACGNLVVTLLAGNFRPGLHTASLYLRCPRFTDISIYDPDYYVEDGWEFMGNYYLPGQIAPVAYATFTVGSEGDPLFDLLDGCCGTIDSIADDIATIKTDVGTLLINVDALDAKIVALDGDVAVINSTLGTMQASIDAIGLKVTSINGTTAALESSLGTLQGTVTAMNGNVATIRTDLGTVKADVSSLKGFLPVDMTPIWIAVVLSLVAAIAAIYAVVVIRGKIAA
ncbi:MAG TPA: Ig-like domain-containing protein [Candidatus Methanomethylicus sp.]|mgnify:CR=1 FL=1|nr:Ig-like domain-containing protein [Candidatus Methanomethylicus sp.]